ncbi:hypothetical protein EYZ11_003648 [Aspergillus tanneri]|uniref:Zn(2)-C6 fungal-type domain-containing protein n=1 Tax=Aspergillus tanneri TaxID=1220188 RepID=A0A4S3JPY2_9EURO|nr:hypothetical protein EYZ11_003648 [Aspergillus tanneri]
MSAYYVGPFGHPFLHQRSQGERGDLGRPLSNRSQATNQHTIKEQLPSVSQLLTPGAKESRPSSPYKSGTYGNYTSPSSTTEASQYRRYGSSSALTTPRNGNLDPPAHPDPNHQQHPGPLPSLARLSPHNLGRETSVNLPNQTNSQVPSIPQGLFHPHGFRNLEREPEDLVLPESTDSGCPTENKGQTANVRSHVVDERYIDGEGLCYIYADGSRCPKIIDGVPVNANWGITKAGKPRKRLAQACLTCREKKIKCQPNLPKCDQCQKSGRECRFESA